MTETAERIHVLLADDHRIVREGLKQVFADAPDIEVRAEAVDGEQALAQAEALGGPDGLDVVVLDIALPGRDGLEVLQALRARWPRLPVLMLSTYPERQYAVRCIKLGAAGYLNKGAPTWIEIDLAQPGPLAAVELVTAQDQPEDITVHEIWVWTTDNQFKGMHTFAGPTSDGQTLTTRFEAVPNVRAVRIATTQATGRTGWREIKLFDR